ncbi:hypothetical protein B0H14DRAFT_2616639 [Mycena olivaceomarginata]|nr:hypothetical protein B0H14DRAFT_2616639 [Mycena olivaceomarginata]
MWAPQAFHELMKMYLRGRAASRYVERGDYSIVLEDGSFIVPARFPETIQAGNQDRKRVVPVVHRHSWPVVLMCSFWASSSTACARNYRIEEQNEDVEELLSPQLQVHILIFDGQRRDAALPRRYIFISSWKA